MFTIRQSIAQFIKSSLRLGIVSTLNVYFNANSRLFISSVSTYKQYLYITFSYYFGVNSSIQVDCTVCDCLCRSVNNQRRKYKIKKCKGGNGS